MSAWRLWLQQWASWAGLVRGDSFFRKFLLFSNEEYLWVTQFTQSKSSFSLFLYLSNHFQSSGQELMKPELERDPIWRTVPCAKVWSWGGGLELDVGDDKVLMVNSCLWKGFPFCDLWFWEQFDLSFLLRRSWSRKELQTALLGKWFKYFHSDSCSKQEMSLFSLAKEGLFKYLQKNGLAPRLQNKQHEEITKTHHEFCSMWPHYHPSKGGSEILESLGYTEYTGFALQFPRNIIPDMFAGVMSHHMITL